MDGFDKKQKQPAEIKLYADFAKTLVSTVRKVPIYPPQHPMIKESINQLYLGLGKIFLAKDNISLSWSNDKFLVEGITLEDVPLSKQFLLDLKQLGLDSLDFSRGVTAGELARVLNILAQKIEIPNGQTIKDVFAAEKIEHVRFNTVRYEKVTEDEKVVKKDEEILPAGSAGSTTGSETGSGGQGAGGGSGAGAASLAGLPLDSAVGIPGVEVSDPKKIIVRFLSGQTAGGGVNLPKDEITAYLKKHLRSIVSALIKKWGKGKNSDEILGEIKPRLGEIGIDRDEEAILLSALQRVLAKELEVKKPAAEFMREVDRLKRENQSLKNELEAIKKQGGLNERLLVEHKRIKQEKERIESVVRSIAEGLVVVDSQGKVLMLNPAAEKILGATKEQKIGSFLVEGLKDEHLLSITKSGALEQEIELKSQNDATKKTIKASSAVIENEQGQTVGMVSMLSDITKQKEVEQLKSNFVASVSHELRAPLISIQKSLSLIIEEAGARLSEQEKKFLDIAQNNSNRLNNLINDLLDIAKLEAGRVRLDYSPIALSQFTRETISVLIPWADSKRIKIEAQCPEAVFEADGKYLNQALTNLIGNAIKFTAEGGRITIKGEAVTNISDILPGNYVKISVQDTGIGIPAQSLKMIFDKFTQVQTVYDAGVKGTGLGLAIVKHIVELHKGKIWVESELGKGTVFTFIIPQHCPQGNTENRE